MPILNLSVGSGVPLSVRRFVVTEGVSSLFTATVWARYEQPDVDLEGIVGQEATLQITHGTVHVAGLGTRTWTGVCTQAEQVHGVTPMQILGPDAYRFSLVSYAKSRMAACSPCREDEGRRAALAATAAEDARIRP